MHDLDFVAAMLAHPEVMKFWPKTYQRDEAEAWIRKSQERYVNDGFGYWLAVARSSGQPIGQAGLLRQEVNGVSEIGIGYIIHHPFWRQGYAAEVATACRDYAFYQLGKRRIVVLVRPENTVSQIIARKLGTKPQGETMLAGFVHTVFVGTSQAIHGKDSR